MTLLFAIVLLSTLILSIFFLTSLINSVFGPYLHKVKNNVSMTAPLISILIPARNEENNISECLNGILNQNYRNIEIIVCNDNSTDDTLKIVKAYSQNDKRLRIIDGKPTPQGWSGKNWACQQLADIAQGKILVFTDADVRHKPELIEKSYSMMLKYKLDFLSAFPQLKNIGVVEKSFVTLVDIIIYSMLPLWTTLFLKFKSFSAANGQWLVIKRDIYDFIGGHNSFKSSIVDDISMVRLTKSLGFRTLTVAGTQLIHTRMYSNFNQIWNGFSKNMMNIFGDSYFITSFFAIIWVFIGVAPFYYYFLDELAWLIIHLFILVSWRLILIIAYKHEFIIGILSTPLTLVLISAIAINSMIQRKSGNIMWKDRKIVQ